MLLKKYNDCYRLDFKNINKEFNQWFLFASDIHFDSIHCDRQLLKKHLDQALEKNAFIILFGDIFDVMQGKYDPRGSKSSLRPEYLQGSYFDNVVRDFTEFVAPYASNILLITEGNHESAIRERQEFDLLHALKANIYYKTGQDIPLGDYQGFIKLYFDRDNTRFSRDIFWSHGYGGNSPVTRGVIQTNRRQVMINADFVFTGHIHSTWNMPLERVEISRNGVQRHKTIEHVSLGCYKNSFGKSKWETQKGFPPASLGGYWLQFFFEKGNFDVSYNLIRAK